MGGMNINKDNIPFIIIAVSIILFFVFLAVLPLLLQVDTTVTKTLEVIDVRTYSNPNGLFTTSDDGYIIKYLDGGEVCSLKISSKEIAVYPTTNESYLVRKHTYTQISYYEYELYLNRFYWVDEK